jgi:hypothetical protein
MTIRDWGMAEVVEHLPSKLSSNPSTTKKKKKKRIAVCGLGLELRSKRKTYKVH